MSISRPAPVLSVVAPCYNEAQGVEEFHRRVTAACVAHGRSYEIVLVNDGSRDETLARLMLLADADPHVVVVNLARNHGHQLALTAGLSFCRGERVFVLDADLQDPPELLPRMWAQMDAGSDVVYGQRRKRDGETAFKLLTANLFYRFINALSETPIPRDTGDFRLMSRRVVDALQSMPERHRFIRGMVAWIGYRQTPLEYDRDPRYAGETKYPLRKMVRFAADAITAFSTKPLRLATYIGLLSAASAGVVMVYAVLSFIFFRTAPGWASVVISVALFGSIQLFVLGIMGEYLGRLYEQTKGRHLYLVDQVYCRGDAMVSGPSGAASAGVAGGAQSERT